jgi:hypothetical protein
MKKVFITAHENYKDGISGCVAVAAQNSQNKASWEDLKVHSRVAM